MEARSLASITATETMRASGGARWALLLVAVPSVGAAAMFAVGAAVQAVVAGEHGQFHALFAAAFLAPALVLAIRRPRGGAAATPAIIGLTIAALSQLVEGVGGFGYGPGNVDRVNGLVALHDLGVILAPIGLVAAALGITMSVAQLIRPRFGLLPGFVIAAVVLAGLGLLIT
jgi:hypothetical protein